MQASLLKLEPNLKDQGKQVVSTPELERSIRCNKIDVLIIIYILCVKPYLIKYKQFLRQVGSSLKVMPASESGYCRK